MISWLSTFSALSSRLSCLPDEIHLDAQPPLPAHLNQDEDYVLGEHSALKIYARFLHRHAPQLVSLSLACGDGLLAGDEYCAPVALSTL